MKVQLSDSMRALAAACAFATLLALVSLTGCKSKPEAKPLVPPALAFGSDVFLGSPLGGPASSSAAPTSGPATATAPAADPGPPFVVEARWYLAQAQWLGAQTASSTSLASHATLVVASSEDLPWQATPRQLAGVRMITGDAALAAAEKLAGAPPTASVLLDETPAVIRQGLTASFRLERQVKMNGATTGPSAPGATTAYLTPLADDDPNVMQLQLAVAAEDHGEARELVVTQWPEDSPGAPLLLVFPAAPGESGSTILVLTVRDADPDGSDAELMATADAALAGMAGPTPEAVILPSSLTVAIEGAAAALADPESRRAALAFLARETEASLAEEVALAADEKVLEAMSGRLAKRWQEAVPLPSAMGFELEREALGALAELDDAGTLPGEMRTLLTIHAGEAGRRAASLEEALRGATTLAELRSILATENAIYLEDSDAAARVRAFEWLAARELAPAGYDPLASRQARRAALDAAMAAPPQTQPTTQGGAQ